MLKIAQLDRRGVRVITCSGELKSGAGDEDLLREFDLALAAGARWIVLDFVGLAWLDSAGVGAVVACSKRADERGAVMKVALVDGGRVQKIFKAVCLDQALAIFGSLDDAVNSFPR